MKLHETMRRLHPVAEPSTDLSARIEKLAADADQIISRRAIRPGRLPVFLAAGVAVAASLAGLALLVPPKESVARTMEAVSANMSNARGVHYSLTYETKPGQTIFYEVWQLGASWRQDYTVGGRLFTQMVTDGKFWSFYPDEKQASYQRTSSRTRAPFDAASMQAQVLQAIRNPRGTNLGTVQEGGRRLQKIAVSAPVQRTMLSAPTPGRSVFWIDKERMIPARIDQQLREKGRWRTVCTLRYDTTLSVSPSVFRVPPGIVTYSVEELGIRAGKRFARPLVQKQFATRTIAIRDVQANRDGDVFILYTDGSTFNERRDGCGMEITDSRGTEYAGTAGAIEPFMYHSDKISSRGMVVDGRVLLGVCAVPLTPETGDWKPRTINLVMRFGERIGKKNYQRAMRFTLPTPKPRTDLLPTYAPDLSKLSLQGGDPAQFKVAREWGRRTTLYNRGDWQGIVRSTDREIRENIADVNTYLSRAEASRNLRQWDGARDALAQAERKDALGFYGDQITEARKKLQAAR
ncbi:MAG: hypothetical protein H8F28_19780 [Fibrella sp.]|nr:hypothetical protein [Armatimonadota bacterium]